MLLIGKLPPLVRGQSLDQRSGQRMFTHIVQGRVVDHTVGVTSPCVSPNPLPPRDKESRDASERT